MEDAGFIIGSYLLTFAVVAAMAWRVVRAGRRLGAQVPDEDKYWL
jgi:hypothetical protein